ncbi:MAG: glucose-6-phosphate dehydrogenase [Deltaproteobacteria bacterium]|nr:MAG: glucose-6-phosphate dehydrogenase [Deltaproteobacteria bacterium]
MDDRGVAVGSETGTVVKGKASDLGVYVSECLTVGPVDPCTIVIFGASGDLTARKLIPALYHLHLNDTLPDPVSIVGCARTPMGNEEFRERLRDAHMDGASVDLSRWDEFAANLYYHPVLYDSLQSFTDLAEYLRSLDKQRHTQGNRIFYLAIPPTLYQGTAEMIGQIGLAREAEDGNGWSRIVVEKPFGRDLPTAMELERTLHRSFHEHQIFRIDHYLAKETVQNILMFRFANTIFEPIWNRSYVSHVGIIASEKLGVEHRAGYYEQSGVLRDMFQNHMMQLLSLTAMEPPSLFEADRVRDEKIKVYRSFKPFDEANQHRDLILGQYGRGVADGIEVPAYREEAGVNPESLTPTFALMRIFVDNWRWRGVPFYLVSGKRLAQKVTRIVVQFKRVPHSMFRSVLGEDIRANRLTLGIYPQERITLTFQTKNPGARSCLRPVTMDFYYDQSVSGPILDAYEKVLLDCMQGDQMLFWRKDSVERCWSFLTPILSQCEACADREQRLHPYESGSWGPEEAQKWMRLILDEA